MLRCVLALLIRAADCLLSVLADGAVKAGKAVCRNFHAAAKPAEDAADKKVIQHLRRFQLAVAASNRFAVVDRLQGGLDQVLDHFLAAFFQKRQRDLARRAAGQILRCSFDDVIKEALAEHLLERGRRVADLLRRHTQRAGRKAIVDLLLMCRSRAAGLLRAAARAAYKHRRERAAACQQAKRCVCAHLRASNTDVYRETPDAAEVLLGAFNVSCSAVSQLVGGLVNALRRLLDCTALSVGFQIGRSLQLQRINDILCGLTLDLRALRVGKDALLRLDLLVPQCDLFIRRRALL